MKYANGDVTMRERERKREKERDRERERERQRERNSKCFETLKNQVSIK